jgi:hypothetical protein
MGRSDRVLRSRILWFKNRQKISRKARRALTVGFLSKLVSVVLRDGKISKVHVLDFAKQKLEAVTTNEFEKTVLFLACLFT